MHMATVVFCHLSTTVLAREVIYTSRAYSMMPVSVCLSVGLSVFFFSLVLLSS